MTNQSQPSFPSMQKFITLLLKNLVDKPDRVKVSEQKNEDKTFFYASVDPEDIGRVIGRKGHTISAIRSIVKLCAIKRKEYYVFEVQEFEDLASPPSPNREEEKKT